jgi:hypothetical protein
MTGRYYEKLEPIFRHCRRKALRAEARREAEYLLGKVRHLKKARRIAEKFERTGTLSKRDIKVLRDLARGRSTVAA